MRKALFVCICHSVFKCVGSLGIQDEDIRVSRRVENLRVPKVHDALDQMRLAQPAAQSCAVVRSEKFVRNYVAEPSFRIK